MTEPEDIDEDLFADLYNADDTPSKPAEPSASIAKSLAPKVPVIPSDVPATKQDTHDDGPIGEDSMSLHAHDYEAEPNGYHPGDDGHSNNFDHVPPTHDDNYGPIGIKEDGKMFIGGLNWETTDQSLKDYFSQFGEVVECTVMRDGASGRSRGFGFLTFKDPKTVNIVMVKEHYLDGKIIDPKRAIPREEQERTSKIFVGGVSQEATERDFREFFMKFGRVIDATLMMDKDTGRPRGFGFVTFDGEAAVDATLAQPLEILGKPIEVKRAQPRGNLGRDEDDKKFSRRGHNDKFGRDNQNHGGSFEGTQQMQTQQSSQGGNGNANMTPTMMAQYWQRMQQYFHLMQQQMAANMAVQGQNISNPMAMGAMNPAMMQQMMAMQALNRGQGMSPGGTPQSQSPNPQAMAGMAAAGGMNPAMLQQMQQMQQMQMQQGGSPGGSMNQRPGYNAHEQLAFEQQKYEQQQVQRMNHQPQQQPQQQQQQQMQYPAYGAGAPTSWEGMYDDVPQPNMPPAGPARGGMQGGGFGGGGRNISPSQGGRPNKGPVQPAQPSQAPANAPTGPKNAGKPGSNYRGGGRMGNRGFHPYARNGGQ